MMLRFALIPLLLLIAVPAIQAQDSYECDTPECALALIESMGDAVDPDAEICFPEDENGEKECVSVAWILMLRDSFAGADSRADMTDDAFCSDGEIVIADDGTVICTAPDGWTVGGDDAATRTGEAADCEANPLDRDCFPETCFTDTVNWSECLNYCSGRQIEDPPACIETIFMIQSGGTRSNAMDDDFCSDGEIVITDDGTVICTAPDGWTVGGDTRSTSVDGEVPMTCGYVDETLYCLPAGSEMMPPAPGEAPDADVWNCSTDDSGTERCYPYGYTCYGDQDGNSSCYEQGGPTVGDEVPMSCEAVNETLYCQPEGGDMALPEAGEAPDMELWNCFSDDSGTERCYPYGYTCYGDQDGNSICYEQIGLFDDTTSRGNNISGCPNIEPGISQQWVLQLWNDDWVTSVRCPRYYPDPDVNNCQWTPGGLVCTLLIP